MENRGQVKRCQQVDLLSLVTSKRDPYPGLNWQPALA